MPCRLRTDFYINGHSSSHSRTIAAMRIAGVSRLAETAGLHFRLCSALRTALQRTYHTTCQHFHILGNSYSYSYSHRPFVAKRRTRRLAPRQPVYVGRSYSRAAYRYVGRCLDYDTLCHNRCNFRTTRLLSNS